MRRALVIAALLAAAPAARAQWDEDEEAAEARPRLSLTAFGGEAFATAGAPSTAHDGPHLGGEVAWQFDPIEVGVLGAAYRVRAAPGRDWSPVVLARLTERFDTGHGAEAAFTFGVGTGRTDRWIGWYQVALGGRFALGGPLFVAGELSFEQLNLLRLAVGVGVKL